MKLKLIAASTLALGLGLPAAFAADNGGVSASDQMQAVADSNQNSSVTVDKDVRNGWFNRIAVTGKLYVDAEFASRTRHDAHLNFYQGDGPFFRGPNLSSSDIRVSQADLFVDAEINSWSKAHVGVSYANESGSILYSPEAYVELSNFAESPFYVQAGRMYTPFGDYGHDEIRSSYTKLLSKTRADAALLGYSGANGFYGNAYIFNGISKSDSVDRERVNNFGFGVGYNGVYNSVGFGVEADYLNNMASVDTVHRAIASHTPVDQKSAYNKRVGGFSLSGDVAAGKFDGSVRYVRAVTEFDPRDLAFTGTGAQPWAAGIELGYSFDVLDNRNSRVYGGYQRTGEALGLDLGKSRWELGYNVDAWKNTQVGVNYNYSNDYDTQQGGTDNNVSILTARLAVHFA